MVSLENTLLHMRGKVVLVNGTRYDIDMQGVAHNVKPEDAQKLLSGSAWQKHDFELPEPPKLSEIKGGPQKVESGGQKKETKWLEPDESMSIEFLKKMADRLSVSYVPKVAKAFLIDRINEAMAKKSKEKI